jgi:acyl carrier protein
MPPARSGADGVGRSGAFFTFVHMATLDALRELAERELDVDVAALDPTKPLTELGVDSLTLADFIFRVEDHFHVTIEMQELDPQLTLADFAAKVDAELARQAEAPTPAARA